MHSKFTLLIIEYDGYLYHKRIIARLNIEFENSTVVEISRESFPNFSNFEEHIALLSRTHDVIHLTALKNISFKENWPEFFKGLNYHREKIAVENPVVVILWMSTEDTRAFATVAPDIWHWRAGVFHFTMPEHLYISNVGDDEIPSRIDQISAHLAGYTYLDESGRFLLYKELVELYMRSYDFVNAQKYLSMATDVFSKGGNAEELELADTLKSLRSIDEPEYTGVLFMVDIVDYTPQSNELGSEYTRKFNHHYENTTRRLCESHGGMFIQRHGDSVLIFFADKKKFLDFAVQLRELSKNKKLDVEGFMGDIRMVAHYGSFSFQLVNENIIDLIGPEGIKVFRMEKYANPHDLLVTEFLRDIIKNDLSLRHLETSELGRVELKGFNQRQTLYKIEFFQDVKSDHSNFMSKRLDALELETKVIPVFGDLYEPMSMEDNFVNLDIHLKHDRDQRPNDTNKRLWERDADFMMAVRKGAGERRLVVDVKTLYETEKHGIILGLPGSGKTTIMKYFAFRDFKAKHRRDASQADTNRLVLFIPCRALTPFNQWFSHRYPGGMDSNITIKPGFHLENVLAYFVGAFLATGERAAPKPGDRAMNRAERWAHNAFLNGCLTLLIDALDEAPYKDVKRDVAEMVKLLLAPGGEIKGGNRVFLTARFTERERFIEGGSRSHYSNKPLPIMEVRPLDMEQMRDMARYFYGEESPLYKRFDQVVWQEEIAAKVGGTPLTALLVIAYFEIFGRFDTRFNMYHIIVVFILVRAWKQMKEHVLNKDMRTFFREAKSKKILKEETSAALMYDALSFLSYEHLELGRVIDGELILEIFSRFAGQVERRPGVTVEEEAEQWLEQMKEDHLLVPSGPEQYVFIHSTVMEYLAARFIHEKMKDPGYLNHIFELPPVLKHLEEKKPGFMETEILPIAVGSGLETGMPLMRLLLDWKQAAVNQAEQETIHRLGLRCLAEYESYVDRQHKRKPMRILHREMEEYMESNRGAVDWVYRFLADVVLSDDPGQLKKALEWSLLMARLSLPVFLDSYLPDPIVFFKGNRETVSLREQILDQLVNRELVSQWFAKHRPLIIEEPSPHPEVKGAGDILTLDSPGYDPDDKNFSYYAGYCGPVLTGILCSPNFRHSGSVTCVTVSYDGQYIASSSTDNSIIIWALSSGKEMHTFKGHTDYVRSVAFSLDGTLIISGSNDKTIKYWCIQSGKELRTFKGHKREVTSVTIRADGGLIISGSADHTIKCWNSHDGKEIRTLKGHGGPVTSVTNSPDGSLIISGSEDGTIKCWNLHDGKEIRTLKGHGGPVTSVTCSPDGGIIISGSSDRTVKCWNPHDGKEIRTIKGHSGSVTSVTNSPDGRLIISGSSDGTVKCWNIHDGKEIMDIKGHTGTVRSVAINPDGGIISGSDDHTIKCWSTQTGKEELIFNGQTKGINSINFSRDNTQIISCSGDNIIKHWDILTGKEIRNYKGKTNGANGVTFCQSDAFIISGSEGSTIKYWDSQSGKLIHSFRGHASKVNSATISHDGTMIISGSEDNTIKLWNAQSGKEMRTLKGHIRPVTCVAFSHDDSLVVSGSSDKSIKCWKADPGKELITLSGHTSTITSVTFNHDGTKVISTSGDFTLKIWNVKSGYCIRSIPLLWIPNQVKPHPTQPGIFLTANRNGTITFFNLSALL